MEIITIESKAYIELANKIDQIFQHICKSKKTNVSFENLRLDTEEVCALLNICPRTLSRLRKEKKIRYTFEGKKCIYLFSDIEQLIKNKLLSCSIKQVEELRSKFQLTLTPTKVDSHDHR